MATTELEDMGEETDGLADGFSKYAEEIQQLTGFSILEEGSTNDYKDLYDIFDGLSAVWDDLSETAQSRVSEILGGTRQLQVISSILNNWTDATDAYDDAMNSAGVSTEAQSVYSQSLTAKLGTLKAAFQELWVDAIDSSTLGFFVDLGTSILELVDNVGLLNTAIIALSAVGSVKGFGLFDFTDSTSNVFSKGINDLVNEIKKSSKNFNIKELLFGSGTISIPDILDEVDASNIIQSLQSSGLSVEDFLSSSNISDNAANALRKYSETCEVADMNSQGLVDTSKQLNTQATDLSKSLSGAGLVGKFKSLGAELLTIGANMAVAYAASLLFSTVFNAISTAVDDAIHHTENLIEAGEEAADTISSIYDEYNSKASTVSSVSERYDQLVNGVDTNTNKNISLTNDEYEEYLSLCNEIADIYPELVIGYTEQGDAILSLGSSAETATEQLYALLEADEAAANFEIAANLQTVYEGAKAEAQQLEEEMNSLIETASEYQEQAENLTQADLSTQLNEIADSTRQYLELDLATYADLLPTIRQAITNAGLVIDATSSLKYDSDNDGIEDTQILQFMGLPDSDQIEAVMSELASTINLEEYKLTQTFSETSAENLLQASSLQKEIDAVWSELVPSLVSTLKTNPNYSQLTEEIQTGITEALSNIDFSSLPDDVDIESYIKETYLYPISGIFNDDEATDVQEAINNIFSIDTSEITVGDYDDVLSSYLETIKDYYIDILGEEAGLEYYTELVINFGLAVEDPDDLTDGLTDAITAMRTELADIAYANGETDIDYWSFGDLTVAQLQAVYEEVTENGGLVVDAVNNVVTAAEEAASSVSTITFASLLTDDEGEASEFSESIDTFQSDIDSINDTLESLHNGEDVSFADLVQEFPELAGQANNLEEALTNLSVEKLKEFAETWETVTEGLEGDELEAASQYFNELLKDIDLSGVVSDVDSMSEAYQRYAEIIAEAEALGVDTSQTIYGNIDTDTRQILEWTQDTIAQYQDVIDSWGWDIKEGAYSTVEGAWDTFDSVDIAYSPILQTEDGAVPLDSDTVNEYIWALLDEMPEGWTTEDLLALDAEGIEWDIDGELVTLKGLIADVGETAESTAEAMHFTGATGAIQDAVDDLSDAKDSFNDTYNSIIQNLINGAGTDATMKSGGGLANVQRLFDEYGYDAASAEAVIKLSLDPEAANWTWEEWLANFEDQYVEIQLRISEDSLEELDNALADLQNDASAIQDSIDLNEALDVSASVSDYNKLISNSRKQIQNLQQQNKILQQEEEYLKSIGADYSEVESEIYDNVSAINEARISQIEWNQAAEELSYAEGELLSAYNDAVNSRNAGDNYLDMIDAFEAAQELYEQGLIGTDEFKAAAAMISANGMEDAENWEENYAKVQRYFSSDFITDDGKYSTEGMVNALNDLAACTNEAGEALATYDAETNSWSVNVDDLAGSADALGISLEAFLAILGRLQDYDYTGDYFTTVDEGISHIADLYVDLAEAEQKLDELEQAALDGDTTVTDTVLAAQRAEVEQIQQSILESQSLLDQLVATDLSSFEEETNSMMKSILSAMDQDMSQYGEETVNRYLSQLYNIAASEGLYLDDLFQLDDNGNIVGYYEDVFSQLKAQYGLEVVAEVDDSEVDELNEEIKNHPIEQEIEYRSAENQRTIETEYVVDDTEVTETNAEIEGAPIEQEVVYRSAENQRGVSSNSEVETSEEDTSTTITYDSNIDEISTQYEDFKTLVETDSIQVSFASETLDSLTGEEGITVTINVQDVGETTMDEVATAIDNLPEGVTNVDVQVNVSDGQDLESVQSNLLTIQESHPELTITLSEQTQETLSAMETLDDYSVKYFRGEDGITATITVEQVGDTTLGDIVETIAELPEDTTNVVIQVNSNGVEDMDSITTGIQTIQESYPELTITLSEQTQETLDAVDTIVESAQYFRGEDGLTAVYDIQVTGNDTLEAVSTAIENLPEDTTNVGINIDVSEDENLDLEELWLYIEKIQTANPDLTIWINGGNADSVESLADLLGIEDIEITATLDDQTTEAINAISGSVETLDGEEAHPLAEVDDQATEQIEEVETELATLDQESAVPTITADDLASKIITNVSNALDELDGKTATTYIETVTSSSSDSVLGSTTVSESQAEALGWAQGTAHADGTAYGMWATYRHSMGAWADGSTQDWALPHNETALVNELGQESIVRDGVWSLLPGGAHLQSLKKDDIIFNAEQTAELLKYGHVISGGGHGIVAHADGTAYNMLNLTPAHAITGLDLTKYIVSSSSSSSSSTSSSSTSSSSSSSSSSDEEEQTALEKFQEWFSKLFDWIEIKLEYMTNKIEKYISKAESYLDRGKYSASARNYQKAIKSSTKQIDNEEQAQQLYTSQAEEVLAQAKAQGLVNDATIAEIKAKIADGSMEIKEYSEEVQEVISSYKDFTDRAQEAADAIEELSNNILTYIDNLKELREAQRDARLDTSDVRTTIGTSTLTYTVAEQNSQLQYTNTQLLKQNNAYSSYVSNMQSDLSTQAKTAESAVSSALSSASPYNKLYIFALQQIQAAIANGTELPEDYVKIVKQYGSSSLAAQLDAYSESYSNYETAKQEAALAYAENSAEYISNIQQQYQNRDDAYDDKISLYTQQADNSDSAEDAIALYKKIDSYYKKILDNDLDEINEYSSLVSSNASTISSDSWKTSEYTSLSKDSEIRERVRSYVRKARQAAKAEEAIPANVLSNIEMYWEEGYISDVFYQACLDYQNALSAKEQAEAAYDMDVEEIAESRSNLGDQAYSAVEQEQENKLQENTNKINLLQAEQDKKTATGAELTEADYQAMAELYAEREKLLIAQKAALEAQRDANVAAGWWTESSQEYIDATNDIAAIDVEIVNCVSDWEELNAAIEAMPLETLQKAIDLLEAYQNLCSSILSYQEATGKLMTSQDYWEAWNAATVTAQNYLDYANMALENYQSALASEDGTYGTMTAAEWYKEYFEALANYNSALAEAEGYSNDIINVPFETIDNELGAIEAYQSVLEAMASLKETQGWSLDVSDYADQLTYLGYELTQLNEKAKYAYDNYLQAYANGGEYYGYYGGKTTKEWLEYLYEIEEQIYSTEEAQEELNNAIAQIPYDTIEAYLELLDAIDAYNESTASLKSASGEDLSESDYIKQIEDNNDQLVQLYEEYYQAYEDYAKAKANGGVYGGLTEDEWLTRYYDLGTEINNIKAETEQLKDELRDDVYWRTFERAHEACENLQSVLEGIMDLIDEDMYFDVDGNLTDFGVAQIGNLIKEWENAQTEVKNYSNDIANLNELYEDGWYTQEEYKEKLAELQEGLLDAASTMKDAMDDIIDMLKEESELELNSILDVIDARNQALTAKKSYYDYDKSLKDSNKNIEQLQAEIDALNGVETAEARALLAQKQAELAEAVEDRDELLLEHSIELSQTALDELSQLLSDNFDDYWSNVSSDMDEMISLLSAANSIYTDSAVEVVNTLNKLLSYYGIDTSSTGVLEASGYASGSTSITSDQLAWTQEDGTELIIRKSDGAILTPLNTGDAVLTAEQSQRLIDLATAVPADLVSSSLSVPTTPTVEVKAGSTINQNYDALIRVDGNVDSTVVTDLEAFARQFYEGAYEYTVQGIVHDARKVGIKAR